MQVMEKALQNLANPMEVNVTNIEHEKDCVVNKDFFKDIKKDQRNFVNKDTSNLFTTSIPANDKDVKLSQHEMSLPSAFFSREGLKDSMHAVLDLSDTGSEEAQINQRENWSWSRSRPSSSNKVVCSESETNKDSNCTMEDLDLVENAIFRLLRKDKSSSSKPHNNNSTKLKDALGLDEHLEESEQTPSSIDSIDLQLLSRLLDQVQTLKEQKYQHRQVGRVARFLSHGRIVWNVTKRGKKDKKTSKDDLKKVVEAATQAAKSAAEAAKNASSLVTKNSEVVGKLLQSLDPSSSKAILCKQDNKTSSDDLEHFESSSDSEGSNDFNDVKAIAKRIVSQNRYTHVVLGVMLVSSFVWRYTVIKFVKKVKRKVSDPWGYVGAMLNDNFKVLEKEKEDKRANSSEGHSNGFSMLQLNLPPLLNGKQRRGKETSTSDLVKED